LVRSWCGIDFQSILNIIKQQVVGWFNYPSVPLAIKEITLEILIGEFILLLVAIWIKSMGLPEPHRS